MDTVDWDVRMSVHTLSPPEFTQAPPSQIDLSNFPLQGVPKRRTTVCLSHFARHDLFHVVSIVIDAAIGFFHLMVNPVHISQMIDLGCGCKAVLVNTCCFILLGARSVYLRCRGWKGHAISVLAFYDFITCGISSYGSSFCF